MNCCALEPQQQHHARRCSSSPPPPQWAGLHYLVAFLIVFLLVNEPGYSGEDKVSTLTAKVFQEECLTDDGSGATRIVFFYTDWSPE